MKNDSTPYSHQIYGHYQNHVNKRHVSVITPYLLKRQTVVFIQDLPLQRRDILFDLVKDLSALFMTQNNRQIFHTKGTEKLLVYQ